MEVQFEGIKKFESLITGDMYDFTPELRERYAAKAITERRFARWCDEHNVGDTYEEYVYALYAFYDDLRRKQDPDELDLRMLEDWNEFHSEDVKSFVPTFDDEDASD